MKKIKNIIINISVTIVTFIILFILMEIGSRIYFKIYKGSVYTTDLEFRLSQPAPYKKSPFYSKEFIEESFKQPTGWQNPEGTRLIIPNDYEGIYFNIKDGIRMTSDQPNNYLNTVYIFGGSTIYCSEVPDSYTVASYLQRLINDNINTKKYRVCNYGTTTVNTYQQLERLKTIQTKLKKNDIIIFYGGVNDCHVLTSGRADGWIFGETLKKYKELSSFRKFIFKIYKRFHNKSKFVELFFYPFSTKKPLYLSDPVKTKKLLNDLESVYKKSIMDTDRISKSTGSQFFNFLQPTIFTRNPNTEYEKAFLLNDRFLVPSIVKLTFYKSYNVLKQIIPELNKENIKSYDLTDIFNSEVDDFYLDCAHVTEKANEIIAKNIFSKIKDSL